MSIPVLIVGGQKPELTELADDLGVFGEDIGLLPVLASDAQEALEVLAEQGPRLMLSILHPEGQQVYDALRQAGYREKFLVYDKKDSKPSWGDREVDFLDPKSPIETVMEEVEKRVLY